MNGNTKLITVKFWTTYHHALGTPWSDVPGEPWVVPAEPSFDLGAFLTVLAWNRGDVIQVRWNEIGSPMGHYHMVRDEHQCYLVRIDDLEFRPATLSVDPIYWIKTDMLLKFVDWLMHAEQYGIEMIFGLDSDVEWKPLWDYCVAVLQFYDYVVKNKVEYLNNMVENIIQKRTQVAPSLFKQWTST